MSTDSKSTDRDTQAILDQMATGRPIDPEIYLWIRAEGAKITEAIRLNHGLVEIAVDLIRESREDLRGGPVSGCDDD